MLTWLARADPLFKFILTCVSIVSGVVAIAWAAMQARRLHREWHDSHNPARRKWCEQAQEHISDFGPGNTFPVGRPFREWARWGDGTVTFVSSGTMTAPSTSALG